MTKNILARFPFAILTLFCCEICAAEITVDGRRSVSIAHIPPEVLVDTSSWGETNTVSEGTNALRVVSAMMTDWLETIYLFRLPMHLAGFPVNRVFSFTELNSFLPKDRLSND